MLGMFQKCSRAVDGRHDGPTANFGQASNRRQRGENMEKFLATVPRYGLEIPPPEEAR
jgi:hypothetical protein